MNPKACDPDLVAKLSAYWLAHPLACDSPDGIRGWWLRDGEVPLVKVIDALSWMVERGLINAMPAADGRIRFRRRGDVEAAALMKLTRVGTPTGGQHSKG